MLYLKWKSNSHDRVFDIPQTVANVGKWEKSCPFPDAHGCASKFVGMFPHLNRHWIFHTEHVADLRRLRLVLKLSTNYYLEGLDIPNFFT